MVNFIEVGTNKKKRRVACTAYEVSSFYAGIQVILFLNPFEHILFEILKGYFVADLPTLVEIHQKSRIYVWLNQASIVYA